MSDKNSSNKISLYNRWLNGIEAVGNKLPHPVALFAMLALLIILISAVCAALGVSATGELVSDGELKETTVTAVSLLTKDGLAYIFSNAVSNFTSYAPLGMVLVAMLGVSMPSFIVGALLQYFLGLKLKLFPVAQWKDFSYTILPTLCLSLGTISGYARSMRTLMLEVDRQDYLKTAKAKGLGPVRIVVFHQIRNAIIPMITNLGTEIAGMLMGSYVIEKIFSIPGMGAYFVDSIQGLDYTMVMGLVIFQAVIVIAANFIVDLLYGIIDPRIRVR